MMYNFVTGKFDMNRFAPPMKVAAFPKIAADCIRSFMVKESERSALP